MEAAGAARPALAFEPLIGIGEVRHHRLRPAVNRFAYPAYFLLLPLRRLRAAPWPALRRNRFGLVAFHDRDHGAGGGDALAWVEGLLRDAGVTGVDGEIWLQCTPRVLGFAFKPVSFWYCHRADGSLAAVVAEVNNTFGERHCYLLDGPGVGYGRELQVAKVFHVSPFCRTEGSYRFRFMRTPSAPGGAAGRIVARVDHHDTAGLLLQTSLSGELQPLARDAIRRAFFGVPLLTLGIVLHIHWQALRLWWLRVPFVAKPAPPDAFSR